MILVYFASGGCVDDVVNNRTFFSYLSFPSQTFTNYRTAGEERRHFFNCSLPFLPASQTLRHQPDNYCREIISAHTKSSVFFSHSRTFMNSARVCWIIKRTVFNVCVCLNHSWRYEHNQFKRCDEKPRHQRQFFRNLDNFYI